MLEEDFDQSYQKEHLVFVRDAEVPHTYLKSQRISNLTVLSAFIKTNFPFRLDPKIISAFNCVLPVRTQIQFEF